MKQAVIVRGALIALVGLCTPLTGCTEDCEGPRASDTLSQYSEENIPKGTPAIRCRVVTRCADAYALNGKYSETWPNDFMIRDRGSSIVNQEACTRRFRHGLKPPLEECVDIVEFVPICAEAGGNSSPSGDVDVTVGVGAGPTSGDYFDPAPNDEGAGEAPGQEGAEPGAGET
jgi:hypothetical protein